MDQDGKPLAGVEVSANCGKDTLRRTGLAVSVTHDSDSLRKALEVGHGLFVESNLSANGIRDMLRRRLDAFEVEPDQVRIGLRQDQTPTEDRDTMDSGASWLGRAPGPWGGTSSRVTVSEASSSTVRAETRSFISRSTTPRNFFSAATRICLTRSGVIPSDRPICSKGTFSLAR